jgi:hypothetical protein
MGFAGLFEEISKILVVFIAQIYCISYYFLYCLLLVLVVLPAYIYNQWLVFLIFELPNSILILQLPILCWILYTHTSIVYFIPLITLISDTHISVVHVLIVCLHLPSGTIMAGVTSFLLTHVQIHHIHVVGGVNTIVHLSIVTWVSIGTVTIGMRSMSTMIYSLNGLMLLISLVILELLV